MPGKKRFAPAAQGSAAKRRKVDPKEEARRRGVLSAMTVKDLTAAAAAAGLADLGNPKLRVTKKERMAGMLVEWDVLREHVEDDGDAGDDEDNTSRGAGGDDARDEERGEVAAKPATVSNAKKEASSNTQEAAKGATKGSKKRAAAAAIAAVIDAAENGDDDSDGVTDHLAGLNLAMDDDGDDAESLASSAADRREEEQLDQIRRSYEKVFTKMQEENKRKSEAFNKEYAELWKDIETSRQHLKRYSV